MTKMDTQRQEINGLVKMVCFFLSQLNPDLNPYPHVPRLVSAASREQYDAPLDIRDKRGNGIRDANDIEYLSSRK